MPGKRHNPVYQAQAILSRRDHSQVEISRKLQSQGFGKQEITKTITWLQEKNFLDDRRFAQAYVESILRSKPVGPRYLSAKLKQKGVADDIVTETITKAFLATSPGVELDSSPGVGAGSRESQLIQDAISQWRRTHPKYAHDRQRLYRFLISRGFTTDAISGSVLPPADA